MKIYRVILMLFIGSALAACDRVSSSGTSQLVIQMPSAPQLEKMNKSDVSGFSNVDLQKLCFAVNVLGPGITSAPAKTCDIERGTLAGSVGVGQLLSLSIEAGVERTFELIAFLKDNTSAACPAMLPSGWNWSLHKIYYLGKVSGVEIKPPEAVVEIPFSIPNVSQNISVQKSWPSTCLGTTVTTSHAMGRIATLGELRVGSAGFRLYSKITPLNDEKNLGTNYKIRNWKVRE